MTKSGFSNDRKTVEQETSGIYIVRIVSVVPNDSTHHVGLSAGVDNLFKHTEDIPEIRLALNMDFIIPGIAMNGDVRQLMLVVQFMFGLALKRSEDGVVTSTTVYLQFKIVIRGNGTVYNEIQGVIIGTEQVLEGAVGRVTLSHGVNAIHILQVFIMAVFGQLRADIESSLEFRTVKRLNVGQTGGRQQFRSILPRNHQVAGFL